MLNSILKCLESLKSPYRWARWSLITKSHLTLGTDWSWWPWKTLKHNILTENG